MAKKIQISLNVNKKNAKKMADLQLEIIKAGGRKKRPEKPMRNGIGFSELPSSPVNLSWNRKNVISP